MGATRVERNRDQPLAEVLVSWRETHRRLRACLERADLNGPHPDPDDPSERAPLLGSGVLDGCTYEHYEEHGTAIRQLLA